MSYDAILAVSGCAVNRKDSSTSTTKGTKLHEGFESVLLHQLFTSTEPGSAVFPVSRSSLSALYAMLRRR
jgi:hypothetical protein